MLAKGTMCRKSTESMSKKGGVQIRKRFFERVSMERRIKAKRRMNHFINYSFSSLFTDTDAELLPLHLLQSEPTESMS